MRGRVRGPEEGAAESVAEQCRPMSEKSRPEEPRSAVAGEERTQWTMAEVNEDKRKIRSREEVEWRASMVGPRSRMFFRLWNWGGVRGGGGERRDEGLQEDAPSLRSLLRASNLPSGRRRGAPAGA